MSHPELVTRVAAVIATNQKIPVESVTLDKTFAELNIDSLDGINLLFALENEFGIDIPDNAAQQIRTVREMVDGIEKLLGEKAARSNSPSNSNAAQGA
jgi:acyl carrier protein